MTKQNSYHLNYIIEQIKEHIDVRDIAEEHLSLTKNGMAHCPFHADNTPSFSVSSKKKLFKCFSCGIGGDVITLYAVLNQVSNGQTIHQLGKRLGLSSNKPLLKPLERRYAQKAQDKKLERRFLELYRRFFYFICFIRDAMEYLGSQYDCMEFLEDDAVLIQYYHERAYHEYLLEGLLAGILEEIDFEQQIHIFFTAKEIVNRWGILLQEHYGIMD